VALTSKQIGEAPSIGTFVLQLQGALQKKCNTVLIEDESVSDYVVRRKFSQKVAGSISTFAVTLATSVASLLPPAVTDLQTVTDVQMDTALSDVMWTQNAYAYILPS
jgi:hypothetical protein